MPLFPFPYENAIVFRCTTEFNFCLPSAGCNFSFTEAKFSIRKSKLKKLQTKSVGDSLKNRS